MKKKKETKVKMSVPEGIEFGTPYTMDSTHTELYWDTQRNIDPADINKHIGFAEKLDIEVLSVTNLLKEKLEKLVENEIKIQTSSKVGLNINTVPVLDVIR